MTIYLFSDILVWGKPEKKLVKGTQMIKYKDAIALDSCSVAGIYAITKYSHVFHSHYIDLQFKTRPLQLNNSLLLVNRGEKNRPHWFYAQKTKKKKQLG